MSSSTRLTPAGRSTPAHRRTRSRRGPAGTAVEAYALLTSYVPGTLGLLWWALVRGLFIGLAVVGGIFLLLLVTVGGVPGCG
jgi:hypothetical protein